MSGTTRLRPRASDWHTLFTPRRRRVSTHGSIGVAAPGQRQSLCAGRCRCMAPSKQRTG
jgi:hypothetical protein